ncbi:hypothetical protein P3X46_016782 [Hevea brasiliensis]|uniref:Membrane-associated kinase regulator 2 n=1 Tax=Hevea brasiliensis TaxID=3981 RepID=A0ABQ9M083_HEVBR|nr:probable membrane-associated kinase regulator 2 [Hevea brasiliensis]KAJ9173669.1 hypothetical protein P3X46_016782 [Hevea brasiliensis]
MEAFSLLKYWRGGGGRGVVVGAGDTGFTRPTTIVTALAQNAVETDDDDDDDGPFFDLEFAVPDDNEGGDGEEKNEGNGDVSEEDNDEDDGEDTDGEGEFNFTISSGSSNDRVDQNLTLSPSDDLFFKGRLVPIESSSLVVNGLEPNSKPQFPASFLKSATKLRVFMLGFKKSKMNETEKVAEANESAASPTPKQQQQKQEEKGEEATKQSKFFTVKFKVEEVPIVSLFTRDNSKSVKSSQKQNNTEETAATTSAASDEKRFSKDVMQRYLKKVKPLYIRISKRYAEKLRFSGQLSLGSGLNASARPPPPASEEAAAHKSSLSKSTLSAEKRQPETESAEAPPVSNAKSVKQGNLPTGLRIVCKHLGKSRSASAVAAAPSAPVMSRRRDDSLLQQQDGIQSAILHCKRSFNVSRDSDSSLLSRSVSDPFREKSLELSRKSSDEGKVSAL